MLELKGLEAASWEPRPVGGHQSNWQRLIYLFSSPHQGISLSATQPLNPKSTLKECLLKLFGLEKGGPLLISLFCSVLASWRVITGGFGFSVSSYLPAGFQSCPHSSSWPELEPYPAEARGPPEIPSSWDWPAPCPPGLSSRWARCHCDFSGTYGTRGSLDVGSSQGTHFF